MLTTWQPGGIMDVVEVPMALHDPEVSFYIQTSGEHRGQPRPWFLIKTWECVHRREWPSDAIIVITYEGPSLHFFVKEFSQQDRKRVDGILMVYEAQVAQLPEGLVPTQERYRIRDLHRENQRHLPG